MNQGKRQFNYGYRLVSQLNLAAIGHTLYSARSDFRPLTSSRVCFEIMLGINNRTDCSFTYFEESAAEKLQCGDGLAVSYYDVPQNPVMLTRTGTCKDKDKDFTYSYLLQVAAKPTIAIKRQQ